MDVMEQYHDYLKQLQSSEDCLLEFRQFVLDNMLKSLITLDELNELVELCKEKGYIQSLSTAYLFLCWITMNTDLNISRNYNQKAKETLEKLDHYEDNIDYISILNNSVLINSNLGRYYDSYIDAKYGIYLAKKYHFDHHLYALINNSTYILLELGLNNQALQQMTLNHDDEKADDAHRVTYWFMLAQVHICLHDFNNALKCALKARELAKKFEVFEDYQFDYQLLEIACESKNSEKANYYFNQLQTSKKYLDENQSNEVIIVTYSEALYYQFIEDYINAEKCFDYVSRNLSDVLGVKSKWLNKIAEFYVLINKPNKANQFYQLLLKQNKDYSEIVSGILSTSQSEVWSNHTEHSHDTPYRLLTNVLELSQGISACLDYKSLLQLLNQKMKTLLPLIDIELLILRKNEELYHYNKNEDKLILYTSEDISKTCAYEGKQIEIEQNGNRYLCTPLKFQNVINGVIYLIMKEETHLSSFERKTCSLLNDVISTAINNIEQYIQAVSKAKEDNLTGLYNREGFSENLSNHLLTHTKMGIVMVDIDDFKVVNDTYGHFAGDTVLQNLAKHLRSIPNGIASRFGGEEFCIAIEVKDEKHLIEVCDELLHRIEKSIVDYHGIPIRYTISAGAVIMSDDESKAIHKADLAMYKAKHSGKNCVVFEE